MARKRKAGAYGPPRGPRRVAIRAHSPENASRVIIELASGDSDPLSQGWPVPGGDGELRGWRTDTREYRQLGQRAFGTVEASCSGNRGPGLHSSSLWSLEHRCNPFLMTTLSFA